MFEKQNAFGVTIGCLSQNRKPIFPYIKTVMKEVTEKSLTIEAFEFGPE